MLAYTAYVRDKSSSISLFVINAIWLLSLMLSADITVYLPSFLFVHRRFIISVL